jgi:Leucine-rich repeat (LRR) protein
LSNLEKLSLKQNDLISKIEGLDALKKLKELNLGTNKIEEM